jgi:cell division protein FtsB
MNNEHLLKVNWDAVKQTILEQNSKINDLNQKIMILQQTVTMLTQQVQQLQVSNAILTSGARGTGPTSR